MNVELGLISANLALLAAHKCLAYGHPIRTSDFGLHDRGALVPHGDGHKPRPWHG